MIDILARVFFSGVAARVNAQKLDIVNQLVDLDATSASSAVHRSRVAHNPSNGAYRSLKGRGIIKEVKGNRIYLDESRLDQVAGASNKFILIAMLVMCVCLAFLFWLQAKTP